MNSVVDQTPQVKKRLYSPGVIAAYSILTTLPFGLLLYAINIRRRGDKWVGTILALLAAIVLVGSSIAAIMGRRVFGLNFFLISVLVAIGLYRIESGPYKKAISEGALPARWWIPALWALLWFSILIAWSILFGPEDVDF